MMSMNQPLRRHCGIAAPLLLDNIDTDQIIPSREMNAVSRDGLGEGLFAGWRYTEPGGRVPTSDFILNKSGYENSSILLVGANFGCGSSREHAVWAIRDFGIRVIIAQSFGDIFYNNCARNGVLAITLSADEIHAMMIMASNNVHPNHLEIDVLKQKISVHNKDFTVSFSIDPYQKKLLTDGLDPIGLTLARADEIERFLVKDRVVRPWVYS